MIGHQQTNQEQSPYNSRSETGVHNSKTPRLLGAHPLGFHLMAEQTNWIEGAME